jgi:hypothetical protein
MRLCAIAGTPFPFDEDVAALALYDALGLQKVDRADGRDPQFGALCRRQAQTLAKFVGPPPTRQSLGLDNEASAFEAIHPRRPS